MRIRLSDLSPGITYALQLRSNTGDAVSDWSRVFNLTTSSDVVAPKTPVNVTNTVSGTAFKMAWDAVTLSADNTPATDLKSYLVLIDSPSVGGSRTYEVTDNKFDFSFENNINVFGSPQASVRVSVASKDSTGNISAYSAPVTATNPAPAAVTGLTTSASTDVITLKWNPNTDIDLTGYQVWLSTTGSGGTYSKVWEGLASTFTYTSTVYGTDHWFRVYAVDVFGSLSTATQTASAVRPSSPAGVDATAPGVPAGLAATLTTTANLTTSAAVSWTAVSDTDLAGYVIGYRPVGATDWQYTNADKSVTSTRIDRLTPYVNYEFRIRAYDYSANYSAWSTTVTTNTAATNAAPPTPAAPTAASATLRIQVNHDNTKAGGGAMDSDVTYYEVYASNASGFTPAATNMLGTLPVGPAISGVFSVPASGSGTTETWYVKVIAVDSGGLKSAASAQATANPNLILTANIGDAQITNAKINDLAANKITAGTGFVNDLTVKSKFTLGDASTDGIIESYDYTASSGTTGFRLAKSGLVIKTGAVEAAALRIQNSQNIVPPAYAGFEFTSTFYKVGPTGTLFHPAGAGPTTVTIPNASARIEKQNLSASWAAALAYDPILYFALSATDYNITVGASEQYIVSYYARATGSVATSINFTVKWSDGTTSVVPATLPASSSTWLRYSAVVTAPASATSALLYVQSTTRTAGAGFEIDGVQVERKIGALTTPSPWTPPGMTSADGGVLRTGEIRSTSTVTVNGVPQPAWSINLAGNMQIGDAVVRGKIVVGLATDADLAQSMVVSGNYVVNTAGWRIASDGSVEFNNGIFRGQLGAQMVTADVLASDLVISSAFRTAEAGKRVEFDQAGFRLYDQNETAIVNFPTDLSLNPTISGDFLAESLTITDQLAIRGSTNELSKGATMTLAAGTTPPTSPPSVAIDWPSVQTDMGAIATLNGNRYGWAKQGSLFYSVVDSPTANASVVVFNSDGSYTGTRFYTTLQHGGGGCAFLGGVLYVLGRASDNTWYVEGYDPTSGSLVQSRWQWSVFPDIKPAIGSDGTNLYLAATTYTGFDGFIAWRAYSGTGVSPGPTIGTSVTTGGGMSSILFGSFDFGSARVVITTRDNLAAKVFSVSGSTGTLQTNESFPMPTNAIINGAWWDGSNFLTHDASAAKLYTHTSIKWTTESAIWWASGTWYDPDATGGTHETSQGPRKQFTMKKRARLTVTTPPLPLRPTPTTTDDATAARLFLARNATDPGSTKMEYVGQADSTNRNLVLTALTLPAPGALATVPPPTTSNFPGSTPAKLQSANGTSLVINGDGSGNWADLNVTTGGVLTIPNRLATMYATGTVSAPGLAAGASSTISISFGKTFPSAPKVFYAPFSSRITWGIGNITTTGCDIFVSNWTSSASSTANTQWMAYL